jgi:hypothetical protein
MLGGALLGACGQSAPNVYPAEARARFEMSCPADNEVCVCTWDKITRALSYEEYEAALERFRVQGSMDPRVTRARTQCLEQGES